MAAGNKRLFGILAAIFAVAGIYFVALRPVLHSYIIGGVLFVIGLLLAFMTYRGNSRPAPKTS